MPMCGKRDNEEKTNHRRRHGDGGDQCSVLEVAASPAIREASYDDDYAAGNAVQETLSRGVPKTHDELAEESRESAVRDVGENAIKEEGIGMWVSERLAELVEFEVLVPDTLLVALYAFDGEEPVALVQPAAVKLAVGDDEEEDDADEDLIELDRCFEF
jgi:hypothetical protein